MSLFPAFADGANKRKNEDRERAAAPEWLENSSYGIFGSVVAGVSSDSSDEEADAKASTHAFADPPRDSPRDEARAMYFEDCERNKRLQSIETLKAGPRYQLSKLRMGLSRYRRRQKRFVRYYCKNVDRSREQENDESAAGKSDSVKHRVSEFSSKLATSPHSIETWIQYASFQDERKCSSVKERYLLNQKKLSILDKGLAANRDSTELLEMKLQVMFNLMPIDQYVEEVEKMLKKDSKNFFLWMQLIKAIQTSCALFSTSRVLNEYKKCFFAFREKSKFHDEQILKLLHQCLLFLRHTGFWEQIWEIMKLSLRLNLDLSGEAFNDVKVIDEKELINMEEMILISKLPLNQLWLRVELLRESCLWTSIDPTKIDTSLVGDEKRLVSIEEISDYIHPLFSELSNFKLVVMFLTCLKVPLLPSRHCTFVDFNMQECSWHVDSLESILPFIYPTVWTGRKGCFDENFLHDLLQGNLTSGPQFLTFHPAREYYLDFVRCIFHTVAKKLPPIQRSAILVWWLRFERLLIFVTRNDPLIAQEKERKKLKSLLKNFLKQTENRTNFYFYQEYILIEYELGSLDSSIQTFKKVVQSSISLAEEERRVLISLYRTMFEILLDAESPAVEEIATLLKNLLHKAYKYESSMSTAEMLYNEILKFLTIDVSDESCDTALLPNYFCDLTSCFAYVSLVEKESPANTLELFDKCLLHVCDCSHLAERFVESKVSFLQYCQRNSDQNAVLRETVEKGLKTFPDSIFLLTVDARLESEKPYWKMNFKSRNVWPILAKCLTGRAQIAHLQKNELEDARKAMVNKMLSFHKIASEVQTCPLVWKLFILLIQEQNLCEKKGEDIYYKAISQFPGVRGIYLHAAQIAPQVVPQIQDLIREKELRMYITPQELDVLRD